ncbi:MAG: PIN domain-containing protein [Propionibacteriaceae bacterium]|jgi:predicted nucleic acid-binding protein|nr:PIN domain-containing protein [Propionibacteriaceae bacterium]
MSLEFVDTNILIYAYDISAGHRHDRAFALIDRLGRQRLGALSVQVLQEFYVTVTRKIAAPITGEVAIERLRMFSRWPVYSPLAHDVISAAELSQRSQISFWDAMIVHGAVQLGCDTLWSEDLNVGQVIDGVKKRSPFAS